MKQKTSLKQKWDHFLKKEAKPLLITVLVLFVFRSAIAEHAPGKLYKRNRGLLKMGHKDLHDFASTPLKGLPEKKGKLYGR